MMPEIAQLADVAADRARLDERELDLIDRARHAGATWAQIAAALSLGSRQAAEQRRQRLAALRRSRRQQRDAVYSARIAAIRGAVCDLGRWIDADRRWDTRFRRATLVRETVEAALDADPGALYALASLLAADLAEAGDARLPAPARAVAASLDALLSTDN
jgi:DNA-binding transcriptional MerR regulator